MAKRVKSKCSYCHRAEVARCDVELVVGKCDRPCCPRHSMKLPNGEARCLEHEWMGEQKSNVLPKT